MIKKEHVIQLDSISKSFHSGTNQLTILQHLTYAFDSSKSYALHGASGSGKSTLINLLSGLDQPTSGNILFDGHNYQNFTQSEREQFLNKKVGLVFQEPLLIPELSVIENVMLKGRIEGRSFEDCYAHSIELLDRVGLKEKAHENPRSLSGGQQQRVSLVRALFNNPDFLLADEPTGNLDEGTGKQIIELMIEYQKERQTGLIIASHDPIVGQHVDTIIELHNGQIN